MTKYKPGKRIYLEAGDAFVSQNFTPQLLNVGEYRRASSEASVMFYATLLKMGAGNEGRILPKPEKAPRNCKKAGHSEWERCKGEKAFPISYKS